MKIINPLLDIMVLHGNLVQARNIKNAKDIIVIEGEDVRELIKIIPHIYENGIDVDSAMALLGKRYSGQQVMETLQTLEAIGVITDYVRHECVLNTFKPLLLHELSDGIWAARKDDEIVVFRAASQNEAEKLFYSISRRWKRPEDIELFSAVCFNPDKCQVFSSRILDMSKVKRTLLRKIKHAHLGVKFFHLKKRADTFAIEAHNELSEIKDASEAEPFWGSLLQNALLHPYLISGVRKFRETAEAPFALEMKACSATHGLNAICGQDFNDMQLGRGSTYTEACGKAVMEALERYCGRVALGEMDMFVATGHLLGKENYIHPAQLAEYSQMQYSLTDLQVKPFDDNKIHSWTIVNKWKGAPKYVPSDFIYYSFTANAFEDGRALYWSNSNGVAAHTDMQSAMKGAVCEMIERDAIMVWWLNKLSPPRVKRDLLSARTKRVVEKIEKRGYQVEILNLTLDLLPVALIVARSAKGEYPYFFCGAACEYEFSEAAEKAALEMELAMWAALQEKTEKVLTDPAKLFEPMDHELYYFSPDRGHSLDFLFKGRMSRELARLNESEPNIGVYLSKKGFELYYKEITSREVADLEMGIVVVRVLIPGLIPITFGCMSEPLAMQRIYELPVRLGLRKEAITLEEVIRDYQPHFFP